MSENLEAKPFPILKIALSVPLDAEFDYLPPPNVPRNVLVPGKRFEVPFGRQRKVGILLSLEDTSLLPPDRLRPAIRLLDDNPLLSAHDLELLRWASRYYHHPLGEVVFAGLSALLRSGGASEEKGERRLIGDCSPETMDALDRSPKQKALLETLQLHPDGLTAIEVREQGHAASARALIGKGFAEWRNEAPRAIVASPKLPTQQGPRLHEAQAQAVTHLSSALGRFSATLLFGVTGSGKTEVYLRMTQEALQKGLQTLILLPEINLTPQIEARFRDRLQTDIRILHSGLTERQRLNAWTGFQRGECQVLLGTRSALFTPAPKLGLIILDEEHDGSFKQQEGFRFSAREAAIMRGHLEGIPVVMGSATPSMETLHNVAKGKFHRLDLPVRAGNATPPQFHVIDIRAERLNEGLSARLTTAIRTTLAQNEQVLLFVNRRGFAPIMTCHACGWTAACRHCDTRLVTHQSEGTLRCHHCGFQQPIGSSCPSCGGKELLLMGLGTERIEEALSRIFPAARTLRIDRDTTRKKGQLESFLDAVHSGEADILIGTQMLAKGHHFPDVTLVGILDVDAGLFSNDFRAGERTAQLIMQVAGRAGRAERPGQVLLQTRHPTHPLLHALIHEGYEAFSSMCLREREALLLPPFSHQALIRADASRRESAQDFLRHVASICNEKPSHVMALGPVPSPLERRGNRYRWQLLLQAEHRSHLHRVLSDIEQSLRNHPKRWPVRWSIDVDPIDLY